MAVLGLRFCARAFSSCGERGPLFIAVRGPLTIAAPPVAEHRLQMRRLSNRGSWAQPLRGTWDLPRPGLEPVSPALAGRFSTTAPPGKPSSYILMLLLFRVLCLCYWKNVKLLFAYSEEYCAWEETTFRMQRHRQVGSSFFLLVHSRNVTREQNRLLKRERV